MSLTDDQAFLLGKLCSYVTDNRRTDKLAQYLSANPEHQGGGKRWTLSHVPFIGLQLRDLGYVTTYKDNGQYARWDVTPSGKAAFVEHNNRSVRVPDPKLAAPVTVGKKKQYAVFDTNEDGFQRFDTLTAADKAAEEWAKESPGSEQIVMEVLHVVKAKVVIDKE